MVTTELEVHLIMGAYMDISDVWIQTHWVVFWHFSHANVPISIWDSLFLEILHCPTIYLTFGKGIGKKKKHTEKFQTLCVPILSCLFTQNQNLNQRFLDLGTCTRTVNSTLDPKAFKMETLTHTVRSICTQQNCLVTKIVWNLSTRLSSRIIHADMMHGNKQSNVHPYWATAVGEISFQWNYR